MSDYAQNFAKRKQTEKKERKVRKEKCKTNVDNIVVKDTTNKCMPNVSSGHSRTSSVIQNMSEKQEQAEPSNSKSSEEINKNDEDEDICYVLVRNIPKSLRSSDLRRFFSDFVERDKIICFHFRHRPEIKKSQSEEDSSRDTRCCLAKFQVEQAKDFMRKYNGKYWSGEDGVDMNSRCLISRVKIGKKNQDDNDENVLSEDDLMTMPELRPPGMMPRGNVGTCTKYFLDAIGQCRLPSSIIGKLKLEFPRVRRKRRYGNVEYGYEEEEKVRMKRKRNRDDHENDAETQDKDKTPYLSRSDLDERHQNGPKEEKIKDDSGSDDDDDTCEEWERHEALHDDVQARRAGNLGDDISQQPGTKERLFEEEMEVTWDKGSSGLVFYTDAQVWKEMEGDFDERTTDDWDVDMSVYYDDTERADKDARDGLDARRAMFRRDGRTSESVFKKNNGDKVKVKRRTVGPSKSGKIGEFERHTRGFGRKIMEEQGWKDGQGLGVPERSGMAEALENEGQVGKTGLGYHGDVVQRQFVKPKGRVRESMRDVIISTAYDDAESVDPKEEVERTNPQVYLKHRNKMA